MAPNWYEEAPSATNQRHGTLQLCTNGVTSTGSLTELMGDLDGAMNAYEQALRHNQWSIPAMNAISCILRTKEQFPKAIEYLQNILKLDPTSGETWGSLGHCHLMMDNLQEAYTSYQQALYHLRDPKVSDVSHVTMRLGKAQRLTFIFHLGT